MEDKIKTEKKTIITAILTVIAVINMILQSKGYETLPFTTDEVQIFLSSAFTVIMTIISYWNDQPWTQKAKKEKEYIKAKTK